MKKIILAFLLFCISFAQCGLWAQEIQVKSFVELTNDLTPRTNRRYDANDVPCALIKVQFPHDGATFEGYVIGDVEFKNNEYWVYISDGTKHIKAHLPNYPTVDIVFADYGIDKAVSQMAYNLEFKFPTKSKFESSFYVEAGYFIGSIMGPEISLGTYLGGFNVELNALLPMGASETGYWQSDEQYPVKFTYKPSIALGGRIGYGIKCGDHFRLTPQVGLMYMSLKETAEEGSTLAPAKGANCASLAIDCKLQYMFTRHFGVSVIPEYDAAIAKSKGFKALSGSSSKIKKWNNGVGVRVALDVEF